MFLHFLVDAGFVRHFLEVTAGADGKSAPMSRTDAELLFSESCEKSRREKGSTRTKRKLPKGLCDFKGFEHALIALAKRYFSAPPGTAQDFIQVASIARFRKMALTSTHTVVEHLPTAGELRRYNA